MRPLRNLDLLIALVVSICSCNRMPECRNWSERVAGECGDGCGRTEEVCVRGRWVEEQCSSYLVPGSKCIPGDMKAKSCGPDSDQAGITASVCESNCQWGKWTRCVLGEDQ